MRVQVVCGIGGGMCVVVAGAPRNASVWWLGGVAMVSSYSGWCWARVCVRVQRMMPGVGRYHVVEYGVAHWCVVVLCGARR